MLGRRKLMPQEGTNGTRNRDDKEQLHLGNESTTRGIYEKSTGLEIAKQIAGCTVGYKESKIGPCGGVNPVQNGGKNCTYRRSQ
jgi:hypothetical protein